MTGFKDLMSALQQAIASTMHILAISGEGWPLNFLFIKIEQATIVRPKIDKAAAEQNRALLAISQSVRSFACAFVYFKQNS